MLAALAELAQVEGGQVISNAYELPLGPEKYYGSEPLKILRNAAGGAHVDAVYACVENDVLDSPQVRWAVEGVRIRAMYEEAGMDIRPFEKKR